jgi:hypothetical protein
MSAKSIGIGEVPWCECGNCYKMTVYADEQCCKQNPCESTTVEFQLFSEEQLNAEKLDKAVTPYDLNWCREQSEQAIRRRKAYVAYAAWREIKKFTTLHSCVKWHIRRKFPEEKCLYTGYIPNSGRGFPVKIFEVTGGNGNVDIHTALARIARLEPKANFLQQKLPTSGPSSNTWLKFMFSITKPYYTMMTE